MTLTLEEARRRIDSILGGYRRAAGATGRSVLPTAVTSGKTYEAWVLCRVLEHLHADEGYGVTLVESDLVRLKSAPGPINRRYAHFRLEGGRVPLEVWTDVEFLALSALVRPPQPRPEQCDYHELDIVVVPAGISDRPRADQVLIGVECKNLDYTKDMLRSLLGVRRELSLLRDPQATIFTSWPRAEVPAHPPSCLLAFSSDPRMMAFARPGDVFGIDFVYEPLP